MEDKQAVQRKEPPRGGSRRSTRIRYSPEPKLTAVRLVLEEGFARRWCVRRSEPATTAQLFLQHLAAEVATLFFANNVALFHNQSYFFEPTVLSGGVLDISFKSRSGHLRGDLIINGLADPLADLWFRERTAPLTQK